MQGSLVHVHILVDAHIVFFNHNVDKCNTLVVLHDVLSGQEIVVAHDVLLVHWCKSLQWTRLQPNCLAKEILCHQTIVHTAPHHNTKGSQLQPVALAYHYFFSNGEGTAILQ